MSLRIHLLLGLLPFLCGCDSSSTADQGGPIDDPPAPFACEEDPSAVIDVTGTFRYQGTVSPYWLRGLIVFEQTGNVVRVLDTTYENAGDRPLEGEGTLVGNRLDILLVPQNGDTDYEAEVTFHFSDDGSEFCCGFSDTNDDAGPMGSYRGVRQ